MIKSIKYRNLLSRTTSLFSMWKLGNTFWPMFSNRTVFSGVFDSVVADDWVFDPLMDSSRSSNLKEHKTLWNWIIKDFRKLTQGDRYWIRSAAHDAYDFHPSDLSRNLYCLLHHGPAYFRNCNSGFRLLSYVSSCTPLHGWLDGQLRRLSGGSEDLKWFVRIKRKDWSRLSY